MVHCLITLTGFLNCKEASLATNGRDGNGCKNKLYYKLIAIL